MDTSRLKEQLALLRSVRVHVVDMEKTFMSASRRVDSDVPAGGNCQMSMEQATGQMSDQLFQARIQLSYVEHTLLLMLGIRGN